MKALRRWTIVAHVGNKRAIGLYGDAWLYIARADQWLTEPPCFTEIICYSHN